MAYISLAGSHYLRAAQPERLPANHARSDRLVGTEGGETRGNQAWHPHGEVEKRANTLRLGLNLAGAFCKWLFIKARTKQEHGSLPVPTGKEQTACSTGLKPWWGRS